MVGAVSPPGGDFSDPVTAATLSIVQVRFLCWRVGWPLVRGRNSIWPLVAAGVAVAVAVAVVVAVVVVVAVAVAVDVVAVAVVAVAVAVAVAVDCDSDVVVFSFYTGYVPH